MDQRKHRFHEGINALTLDTGHAERRQMIHVTQNDSEIAVLLVDVGNGQALQAREGTQNGPVFELGMLSKHSEAQGS